MKSISFFDSRYPVRTVFTDNSDWQGRVGWHAADVRKSVMRDYLRIPLRHVFYACEVNSNDVLAITDENFATLSGIAKEDVYEQIGDYDAMVTSVPNVMLCVCTADCLPLYLYDTRNHIAGMAHCGWRGICSGVVSNVVDVMVNEFDASSTQIIAGFGPAICENCFEVGGELKEAFATRFSKDEIERLFRPKSNGKYLLDPKKAVTMELVRRGVRSEGIYDTGICSFESQDYPSYRRCGHLDAAMQTFSGIVLCDW